MRDFSGRMSILVVSRCIRSAFLFNIIPTRRNPYDILGAAVACRCFRSTPPCLEKWKTKWPNNSSSSVFQGSKPSKTYIKYKTRQKRADAKKALNDLLFRSGKSRFTLEGKLLNKHGTSSWDGDPFDPTGNKNKRDPLKSAARNASKPHQKRNRSKLKKGNIFEDFYDDDPGMHFQATYVNQWYSWSFKSWEEVFSQRQTGFEWREDSNGNNNRNKWRTPSDDESTDDDESCVGAHADRITLGLPINGPLKIDEVKNAFRLSALKWHPDKHQGPSQALAEEKFKVCVTAYKSLCNSLSTV